VGSAAWFLTGLTGKPTVSLGNESCRKFDVDRFAIRRGLDALASAGLVEAQHRRGRNPLVTLRNDIRSDPQGRTPKNPE
jgi:DNA-binding transcriptional ArsR family regulator